MGPFWVTPSLELTDLGLDSNVTNTRGKGRKDFTATVTPKIDLLLNLRRIQFGVTPGLGLSYFYRTSGDRSVNRDVAARLEAKPIRLLRLSAAASDVYSNSRYSAEVDARAPRRNSSASAGIDVVVGRKLSAGISGATATARFDPGEEFLGQELAPTLNQDVRSATARITSPLTPLTTVSLETTVATHRFPLSPSRNADTAEYLIGADLKPRALVFGEGHIGYSRYLAQSAAVPQFRGLVGDAELTYRLTESMQLGTHLGRQTGVSYDARIPYYVLDRYGMFARKVVTSRTDVTGDVYVEAFHYRGYLTGPQAGTAITDERVRRYTGEFGFRPRRSIRIGLHAGYVERLSEVLIRDYTGFRAWSSVSFVSK